MKHLLSTILIPVMALASTFSHAANYEIDSKGAHASINFTVSHLNYSFTSGRFNKFNGAFIYDPENLEQSHIALYVDVSSIDTNHAERDKHIRSEELLNTKKHTTANFVSTKITKKSAKDEFLVTGNLTLNGVTKAINIDAKTIGAGPDPWGGERAGFSGTTKIELKDFDIPVLGASSYVDLTLYIEGIKIN